MEYNKNIFHSQSEGFYMSKFIEKIRTCHTGIKVYMSLWLIFGILLLTSIISTAAFNAAGLTSAGYNNILAAIALLLYIVLLSAVIVTVVVHTFVLKKPKGGQ
ncbi:hypothetical protein [Mycoplasmopsis pullorum]|uniref:hypothetical protein n=2 Tax=Mycoplasmopsis pullorum TaxID=48003 RepID=UPI00111B0E10|nr:hypothetical protein [Mycoplasmopsis pullorum]